jgi:hydroxymethylpyrimidine/phosphomethylpyrimidine kinase
MRGTGCALAMAIACELAGGSTLRESVTTARIFTRTAIENAPFFHGIASAF